MANCLLNSGNVYFKKKNFQQSKDFVEKAISIFLKIKEEETLPYAYKLKADINLELKDYKNALELYLQILGNIQNNQNYKQSTIEVCNAIGMIYLKTKNYKKSYQYLKIASDFSKTYEDKKIQKDTYYNLSEYFLETKNPYESLKYFKLYYRLDKEFFNEKSDKRIVEMQTKYDTEKKVQEINDLKKDQTIKELALKQARAQRIAWISGFLLVFIVLILLFLRYRRYLAFWKKEKTIGKYKLIERIGFGGFGKIHKALDSDSKKIVAIKELHENQMDEEAVKRFQSEGIIIERLHHPNIVKFIDKGEINNKAYIVMEYIDGITLSDKIQKESPIDITVCEHIAKQLATVIHHLHERNIIHRDLKPSNIMLVKNETPFPDIKLLDFGIAKTKFFTKLTETGIIPGSIYYMSPEQKNESPSQLKASCDIFSLGLMFYEMFTGIYPYEEESNKGIEALSNAINNRDPKPPRECRPDIPEAIEQLIARMIQKSADLRPSAEEVMKDLGIEIVKEEDE